MNFIDFKKFKLSGRSFSSQKNGSNFSDEIKEAVWNKGKRIYISQDHPELKNPNKFRKDACGALIEYDKYGDTTAGGTGWEIDHIIPVAKGGLDNIENLQPLQWQNNRKKSDNLHISPEEYCEVKFK